MSGPLHDCYALAAERSSRIAVAFLEHFLPDRDHLFDPLDPAEVLGMAEGASVEDIFSFLEANPDIAYSMYWSNRYPSAVVSGSVTFTADGHLILGLATCPDDDPECAESAVKQMMAACGAEAGYAVVEESPAASREDFLRKAEVR